MLSEPQGGEVGGSPPPLQNPLSDAGKMWKATTLCATSLLLTLGPAPQMPASQAWLLSLPLQFAQWGLPRPFLAFHWGQGCARPRPSSVSVLPSPCSLLCAYLQMSVSDVSMCPTAVTSQGETCRSSHSAMLLMSVHLFLILVLPLLSIIS